MKEESRTKVESNPRVMRALGRTLLRLAAVLAGVPSSVFSFCPQQPMRFDHITPEEGLSQVSVLAGLQDSDGFMWFATEDGLNRFDGRAIRVFKNDPVDQSSLANDTVWALSEDDRGGLWIATFGGGLSYWNPETERFRTRLSAQELGNGNVRALKRGADGILWIGTVGSGLFSYDPSNNTVVSFRSDPNDPETLPNDAVYAILEDSRRVIWVATDGGLGRLDTGTGRFTTFFNNPKLSNSLSDDRVRSLCEDHKGEIWVGTRGGLNRFRPESDDFERYLHRRDDENSLSHDRVRTIFEDRDGRLWVGTASGLNLMDREHGHFVRYLHDPAVPTSLSDDYVMSIFEDSGGLLWIGTRTGGVNRWNPATWSFGHHEWSPTQVGGLSAGDVTAFSEDPNGGLWIGTFGGGLNHLDRKTGEYRHFKHDPAVATSIPSDRIMALEQEPSGGLWLGTYSSGLGRLKPDGSEFVSFRHDPTLPDSLSSDRVTSVLVDRRGRLWVGTFGGGLNHLKHAGGLFESFRHDPAIPGSLSSDKVTCLAEDTGGLLWIGTDDGGINLFDPSSGVFSSLVHDPDDLTSLASNDIFAIHVDADNTLWAGSRGAGISRMERTDGPVAEWRFANFSERDGLANDVVYGLLSDTRGDLWMSTNSGLSRFDRTERFTNFTTSDGLQAREFHFGSSFRSSSGEMFFGGVNGFNAFRPEELEMNRHFPPVVLTGLFIYNQPVAVETPLARLREVKFGYRDDVVTYEFAALDFAAPKENRFRYRLDGFNDHWIEQGPRNQVTFTNLDAGQYVLRVQAANSDGLWNEDGLALEILVAAPPWLTWWAKALWGVCAVFGLIGYLQLQSRKLKREQRYSHRLKDEVKSRTKELEVRYTQLQVANERLRQASLTDPLTGLWNRRYLFEHVTDEVALVRRRFDALPSGVRTFLNSGLIFLMIDLDQFKRINDSYGHPAGDEVLLQVRDVLKDACRDSDILIRWGGDEFLIVARDTSLNQAETIAERIRVGVGAKIIKLSEERDVRVSCSIGFACYPFLSSFPDLCSWEYVLSLADSALFGAKNSGRNAWVGLVSTGRKPSEPALNQMRFDPGQLVEEGFLEARSSLSSGDDLTWA